MSQTPRVHYSRPSLQQDTNYGLVTFPWGFLCIFVRVEVDWNEKNKHSRGFKNILLYRILSSLNLGTGKNARFSFEKRPCINMKSQYFRWKLLQSPNFNIWSQIWCQASIWRPTFNYAITSFNILSERNRIQNPSSKWSRKAFKIHEEKGICKVTDITVKNDNKRQIWRPASQFNTWHVINASSH